MAKIEQQIANGFGGQVELSLVYDDITKEILEISTKDETTKLVKPTIKIKTDKENDSQDVGKKKINFKEKYFMVIDKEFGGLVTPSGFEVELNIPFA